MFAEPPRLVEIATAACRGARLDPSMDGRVLRACSSAIVEFPTAGLIARIETPERAAVAVNQSRIARFLHTVDAPVATLAWPDALLVEGSHPVTLWWRLEAEAGAPHLHHREVGTLLRVLHDRSRGAPSSLPASDPFLGPATWIRNLSSLDSGLVRALSELQMGLITRWTAEVGADPLGTVVLHGDAHHQNVIRTAKGPIFIDLEDAGVGSASWDFAFLGAHVRRYGLDPRYFEEFAAGYGADPRSWSGFHLMCEVYEWHAAVWAAGCHRTSARMAHEGHIRVRSVLGESSESWTLI